MTSGEKLLAARTAVKLSQKELGDRIGYSRFAVMGWEKGTHPIPVEVLEDLAQIFKLDIAYFLNDDTKMIAKGMQPLDIKMTGERVAIVHLLDLIVEQHFLNKALLDTVNGILEDQGKPSFVPAVPSEKERAALKAVLIKKAMRGMQR